jgi:O-antigen/teichoic acid export membrane protein
MHKVQSRKRQSLKNVAFSTAEFVTRILFTFVVRIFTIWYFGVNYLGLNSLFTNILFILSIAELGIAQAITYLLYRPIAENNIEKIKTVVRMYKRFYIAIGCIVLAVGLLALPLLPFLISDTSEVPSDISIYILFLILLAQSASSYFLGHRRSLVLAAQRKDIDAMVNLVLYVVTSILQIAVMIFLRNFYLVTALLLLSTIINNLVIFYISKKLFPNLDNKNVLPFEKTEILQIKKNVFALFCERICGVIIIGKDGIIISAFIGITFLGLYSNYLLIIASVTSLLSLLLNSTQSSIGNFITMSNKEQSYSLFKKMNFAWVWIVGFCAIALVSLFQPFVATAFGDKYLLDFKVAFIVSVNFFLYYSNYMVGTFMSAYGLFWEKRYLYLFEVVINLTASLVLVQFFGIYGVVSGTIISTLCVFWVGPLILFKKSFKQPAIKHYIFLLYMLATIVVGISTYFLIRLIPFSGILGLAIKTMACAIIPNALFLLCYFYTPQFKAWLPARFKKKNLNNGQK